MSIRCLTVLTLTLLICSANTASAGLYNTSEPDEGKLGRDNFELVFRDSLIRLRTLAMRQVPLDNPLRKRYQLAASLAGRLNPANLTSEQKLNLSAVLIRTGKADEARDLLEPQVRQEPKNFLLLGNLATACQLTSQESRAIVYLEQALALWPKSLGEVDGPLRVYLQFLAPRERAYNLLHKAEKYQLKLLRLRQKEPRSNKSGGFETVDALFDDGQNPPHPVRFVGDSGKFEPGALAAAEKAKLPKDAIEIVQQLLIWLPGDDRLYWLLGELYNAQGGAKNIRAARMIFDELAGFDGRGVRAHELLEHRQALLAYHDTESDAVSFEPTPRAAKDDKSRPEPTTPRIDWQTLGLGAGIGFVVGIFGMWQLREIRRRRLSRPAREL
jgi:tetratricopeptide (TPR) repeat protein